MNPIETLTDEALLLKLRGTEHDFVERKPRGQKGDWLQVAVAFANSAPIGWPAVLFVGVDDVGTPQQGPEKLEDLSKSVAAVIEQAYPPIYFDIRPLHIDVAACLAVVIPGSESRPHFAGRAYVRVGPETREASEGQFAELIASRSSKVGELQKWTHKEISLFRRSRHPTFVLTYLDESFLGQMVVHSCSQHYVTFAEIASDMTRFSEPLHRIELSFDHQRNRLQVFIYADR